MNVFSPRTFKYATIYALAVMMLASVYVGMKFWNLQDRDAIGDFMNLIHTGYGERESANRSQCESLMSKQVTDDSLLEFYQTCIDNSPNTEQLVGPDLFNKMFVPDVFSGVKCDKTKHRFIKGQELVALASVPGSYNTWTRILLEHMTGKVYSIEFSGMDELR